MRRAGVGFALLPVIPEVALHRRPPPEQHHRAHEGVVLVGVVLVGGARPANLGDPHRLAAAARVQPVQQVIDAPGVIPAAALKVGVKGDHVHKIQAAGRHPIRPRPQRVGLQAGGADHLRGGRPHQLRAGVGGLGGGIAHLAQAHIVLDRALELARGAARVAQIGLVPQLPVFDRPRQAGHVVQAVAIVALDDVLDVLIERG